MRERKTLRQKSLLQSWRLFLNYLRDSFVRPLDALPLDLFRILTGLLILAYFIRTFLEAPDFSGPDGLIDHEFSLLIFWFTRIGLFQPWMTLFIFQGIFLFACVCSFLLIIGYRVKIFTAILFLISVSTYRWNFLVMYVDDAIMHLMIFWLLLLPVGRTLVLSDWLAEREAVWERWKKVRVPGAVLRCFFWNLALIYIVAGLWKWTSPMWRDGTALYVVFKLPISYAQEFWAPEHLPLLKVFSYGALILEPLFALLFVLPKGHYAKYILLAGLVALHIGSVATLDIPFANLACVITAVLIFGEEIMEWIRGGSAESGMLQTDTKVGFSGVVALFMVTMLTLAMISSVSLSQWRTPTRGQNFNGTRTVSDHLENRKSLNSVNSREFDEAGHEGLNSVQTTFFGTLWCMGIAQQYQLFNWIDERNYSVSYRIIEYDGERFVREIDPDKMFLPSTRGVLLQFYLHGITWVRVPPSRQEELRKHLLTRTARRYCRNSQLSGEVVVHSSLERISPTGPKIPEEPVLLMKFSCQGAEPLMKNMNINP